LDYELSDGSVLRVFKNRESIDLISLAEGSLPSSDNEAVIERRYAEEHSLAVGDIITVGAKTFTISGIGVTPDYNSPVKNLTDTAVDSVSFGTMFVTSSSYEVLLSEGNAMKSEEYTYAYSHALWKNLNYNQNAEPGEAIVVTETKLAWQWWQPALISLDILVYGAIAIGSFVIIRSLIIDRSAKQVRKED